MNSYQAESILDQYQGVPPLRPDQEELIRHIYPAGKVRGGRPLDQCSDAQIFRVAERLYREALKLNGQPVPQPRPRQPGCDPRLLAQVQRDWADRLYEMFNILPDQRVQVSPADLEARLLD